MAKVSTPARLALPFVRFARLESASSILLLAATAAALLLENSPWAHAYESALHFVLPGGMRWTAHHFVNDGLMTLFFLTVGLEVRREFLVGELRSVRRALLPVLAAVGGVLTPAMIYLLLNRGSTAARGWGIPIATDVAFSLAVLAIFRGVPTGLRVFLVALAIVDDIAGVAVIAIAYTRDLRLTSLALAALAFGVCLLCAWRRMQTMWVYTLLGFGLWIAVTASGVHSTIAGILLALAVPFERPAGGGESVARRMEEGLHPWVSFGVVPLFALVNAGIPLRGLHVSILTEPLFLGVVLGLLVGKPLGITLFSWIAVRLGLGELPRGANWAQLHAVAWLGCIGFTVSIFIAGLAFEDDAPSMLARMAVLLASVAAAGAAMGLLSVTARRKENPQAG